MIRFTDRKMYLLLKISIARIETKVMKYLHDLGMKYNFS